NGPTLAQQIGDSEPSRAWSRWSAGGPRSVVGRISGELGPHLYDGPSSIWFCWATCSTSRAGWARRWGSSGARQGGRTVARMWRLPGRAVALARPREGCEDGLAHGGRIMVLEFVAGTEVASGRVDGGRGEREDLEAGAVEGDEVLGEQAVAGVDVV